MLEDVQVNIVSATTWWGDAFFHPTHDMTGAETAGHSYSERDWLKASPAHIRWWFMRTS